MNKIIQLHETYTDESNSIIKIPELLECIKDVPTEEQNEFLTQILEISEQVNKEYKKDIKEHESFLKKRDLTKIEKRKVVGSKPLKAEQKPYVTDAIKKHEEEIKQIINMSFEDFKKHIGAIENLNDKLNYFMLGLIKEICAYNKLADEAYLNKDKNFLNDIRKTSLELQEKLNYLKQNNLTPKVEDQIKTVRIIFLETSSKRAYFLQDIKGKSEFYYSFNYLLSAIEEGHPENAKQFEGNSELKGATESRDVEGKTRIFFDKLDNETYVVYNAIIKKDDNSLAYRNQAIQRYKYYLSQKNYILKHLNDEDFLERQASYLEQVQQLFAPAPKKSKKLTPNEGGGV